MTWQCVMSLQELSYDINATLWIWILLENEKSSSDNNKNNNNNYCMAALGIHCNFQVMIAKFYCPRCICRESWSL